MSDLTLYMKDVSDLPRLGKLPDGYSLRRWTAKSQRDIQQILALLNDTFPNCSWEWSEHAVRETLVHEKTIKATFLLEYSLKIVGMASVRLFEDDDFCGEYNGVITREVEALHREFPHAGKLTWVAVASEHSGKKLGRHITAAALQFVKAETDRTAAYLETKDFRLAAIKTYLDLGFMKVIRDITHEARWEAIEKILGITT